MNSSDINQNCISKYSCLNLIQSFLVFKCFSDKQYKYPSKWGRRALWAVMLQYSLPVNSYSFEKLLIANGFL